MSRFEIMPGDCLDVLRGMDANSVDSIVTDPPYGLGFMGKHWDHGVPDPTFWREMMRVLKPGGHLLSFGGSRTYHRMACAIEDAGFEVRDCIMWLYGSGFPKSLDVSKAIDKAAGAERDIIRPRSYDLRNDGGYSGGLNTTKPRSESCEVTAPATDAARQWSGWGTALKPAHEPIIVARKPLEGTVAANVLKHGVGAINVDGCRVGDEGGTRKTDPAKRASVSAYGDGLNGGGCEAIDAGRWPANVIHDGSDEVVGGFPQSDAGKPSDKPRGRRASGFGDIGADKGDSVPNGPQYGDTGSAARFFYCAKASKVDREDGNNHPTVKPTALMRYLCRLVTPPGGLVLDPFTGSGSTGKAAILEGFRFIGIEREMEYVDIARARCAAVAANDNNEGAQS